MPSRYWRLDWFEGVDLLRSDASAHRYTRHSHEGYALGVVEAGAHSFAARGEVWSAIPGRVIAVNPDAAHDGGPTTRADVYSYRMIYVDAPVFSAALDEATGRRVAMPFFSASVFNDLALSNHFLQVHRIFERMEARLECEALLLSALIELARRHGGASPPADKRQRERRAIARALEYLVENFAEDCSLTKLATLSGVDRFYLLRTFRHCLGLPPHIYQTQLRLRHAKRLMLAGEAPAMAAVAAGFSDQSHLIRKFKSAYGVTPGEYLGRRAKSPQLQ